MGNFIKDDSGKKSRNRAEETGFTLIEVLVVISIVAFLMASAVTMINFVRQKGKIARYQADVTQILKQIDIKREEKNQVLGQITGNFCSECACRAPGPTWTHDSVNTSACLATMTTSFQRIGFPNILIDPWGDPYMIDENETEFPASPDNFWSINYGGRVIVPMYAQK